MEPYQELCQLLRDNKFKMTNMQTWSHIHIHVSDNMCTWSHIKSQYPCQQYYADMEPHPD